MIKKLLFISIILCLIIYISLLKEKIKMEQYINRNLQEDLLYIQEKNNILKEDFNKSEEENKYYINRYNVLKNKLNKLEKNDKNFCVNQKVSEDLLKILKEDV